MEMRFSFVGRRRGGLLFLGVSAAGAAAGGSATAAAVGGSTAAVAGVAITPPTELRSWREHAIPVSLGGA
jgi:hypothetical protein